VIAAAVIGIGAAALIAIRLIRNADHYASAGDVALFTLYGFEDRTTYAPSYSEEGFKRVRAGMTEQAVRGLIGEPLRRWSVKPENQEVWSYSSGARDASYWQRLVIFDGTGHVARSRREYNAD